MRGSTWRSREGEEEVGREGGSECAASWPGTRAASAAAPPCKMAAELFTRYDSRCGGEEGGGAGRRGWGLGGVVVVEEEVMGEGV